MDKIKLAFRCNGGYIEISKDDGVTWDHVVSEDNSLGHILESILNAAEIEANLELGRWA